jgi:hypothetical protein
MVKTLTPERTRPTKAEDLSSPIPQAWEEFCLLYPIYDALARQLSVPGGAYPNGSKTNAWTDKRARERDVRWLEQMDRQIQAVDLRHFLVTPAVAREDGLRMFLQRHLLKGDKQPADRDKIDLLLVQYFVLCAPQEMIDSPIDTADVAQILQSILDDAGNDGPPEVCEPLEQVLELARNCNALREFMEQGLLEQGKLVKMSVGDLFYEPGALVSICRFNFMLRRFFIQLLHADLRAIGAAISQLEKRGVKSVDCRSAGFSSKEPVAKLRQFHEHWKPPFQNDYSRDSAFQPYEQLMSLRQDLEDALSPPALPASPAPATIAPAPVAKKAEPAKAAPAAKAKPAEAARPAAPPSAPTKPAAPAKPVASAKPAPPAKAPEPVKAQASALPPPAPPQEPEAPEASAIDIEGLEEKVWEQLISTPPTRGRSMTTVTVDNARILLSAWEVAAFVSESGQDSEDLRRLIVTRALLSTAIERRKRSMDMKALHQGITHARTQIPRFQERVDQLKRTMKTDGAVNLGISLKRLLSLVEEAEQLQKGNEPKKK